MADSMTYCWNFGTTSFRVNHLNLKIEQQLSMLSQLYHAYPNCSWQELQEPYYRLMQSEGFVSGDSRIPHKDAREKTSGLVELGLLSKDREITAVGSEIIRIIGDGDFASDNFLNIDKDSFIYLKQFLKMQVVGGKSLEVKPFLVLLKLLADLDYLSKEEFTYILPLCTKTEEVETFVKRIQAYRNGDKSLTDMIDMAILNNAYYRSILDEFTEASIDSIEEFDAIYRNRKGGKYTDPYYKMYALLLAIYESKNISEADYTAFLANLKAMSGKPRRLWRGYFDYTNKDDLTTFEASLWQTELMMAEDLKAFKKQFYLLLTRAKWMATLSEYDDLNRRYLNLTGIFKFEDSKVTLDLLPKYYFKAVINQMIESPYYDVITYYGRLHENLDLSAIDPSLVVDMDWVYEHINQDYPELHIDRFNYKTVLHIEHLNAFEALIEREFDNPTLLKLLSYFQAEENDKVVAYKDWDASGPTIFEYVLAIAWYKISEHKTDVLSAMNLSLDTNLYPKSHATGGQADLVFCYDASEVYEAHTLLLEATLTSSTNQRRAEMEPVSRHIMRYLQDNDDQKAYALFVANYLHEEVLSDFRNKKSYVYRKKDGSTGVGLSIASLDVGNIIYMLENHITYEQVYQLFDEAFKNETVNDLDWYKECIHKPLLAM